MKVSRSPHAGILASIITLLLLWQGVSLAAQEGSASFPVDLAPTSITAGEPWTLDASLSEATAEREVFVFSGTNDLLMIGYVSVDSVGADPILAVLGSYADVIGPLSDLERGSYYALQSTEIAGTPYGTFSVIYSDRHPGIVEVHLYLSPVSTFDSGMESVQAAVIVGEQQAFLGVDARMLQAMMTGFTGPGDALLDSGLQPPLVTEVPSEPTPEPEVITPPEEVITPDPESDPTPAPTSEPESAATPVSTDEPSAETVNERAAPSATPEPEPESANEPDLATPSVPDATPAEDVSVPGTEPAISATPVPEISATPATPVERPGTDVSVYRDLGIQEDGHYISPQFGTEVRWDARWTIMQTDDSSAVRSDPDSRTDSLSLVSTEYPDIAVNITLMSASDFGMSDWVGVLESRDQDAYPAIVERIQEDQGVVVLVSRDGQEVFMYDLAASADGSVFRELEVLTVPQLSGQSLDAVAGGIQIDGEPMFRDMQPGDVEGVARQGRGRFVDTYGSSPG